MIEGHIFTKGVITKDYPDELKAQIDSLPQDTTNIIHHISSGGGNCYAGYKGYHLLMAIGKPIKSIIEGEAQSMATFLAIAPANEVEILDPSTFMIHEPFFPDGLEGALSVDDLSAAKDELEQIRTAMANAYAKKTGKPVDQMLAMMKKTTRMDAGMARAAGFVDKVTEPRKAIAFAEAIKELKQEFKNEIMNIKSLFNSKATALNLIPKAAPKVNIPVKAKAPASPLGYDVNLADGTILSVDAPNEDSLIGANATINGAAAPDGDYVSAPDADDTGSTGDTITVVGGVVTAVTEPDMSAPRQDAQPDIQKTLQKQINNLNAQLAQIQAEKEAKVKADADKADEIEAQKKTEEAIKALADKEKEVVALAAKIKELEALPVGNQKKPDIGMNSQPVGFNAGKTSEDKKLIMATRTFLAEEMPFMERYYKNGKYSDGTDFMSYRVGGPNAVSILETNFNYTWSGILTTDLFFKPTLGTPALSDIFTVDQGVYNQKRYNLVPALSNILQPYTGCVSTPNTDRIQITNATIQMKEFRMYEGWCKDDFTQQLSGSYNFLAQEWLKTGEAQFDPAGTPIDKIIVQQLKDGLRRDIFQRVSFASGASSSTNYNQFDGLWKRLIDSSGASNYCVVRYGNALGVGALGSTAANDYFTGIFNNSNLLLKQEGIDSGEAQFVVTRSVWENYYAYLVAVGSVSNEEYINYLQGIKRLTFRGIPVMPVSFWDQSLADANNPLSATTRHLILFTLKRNHILGVENTADLNNITSWYEMKDSKRYYRADMKLGYQYLHCDLQTISY